MEGDNAHRKIQRPELLSSIASRQDEKNESSNQSSHDQHPVLALETQKIKMSDKKFHRAAPRPVVEDRRFSDKNILFLYAVGMSWPGVSFPASFDRRPAECSPFARGMHTGNDLQRCCAEAARGLSPEGGPVSSRAKRRTKRQQLVEFRGMIADAIRRSDEDLPTLVGESAPLGDSDDNAQPDGRHCFPIP
jgi:hypothetical protein